MIGIDTIATMIATELGMDESAAHHILTAYHQQMINVNGTRPDPDALSAGDAAFLAETVRQAHKSGDLAQKELAELERITDEYDTAHTVFKDAQARRRAAIITALRAGAKQADVARAAGISRSTVSEIAAR